MGFSTTISVPSRDADRLMQTLADAGFLVLDNGSRITTDDALDGEANLEILWVGPGAEEVVAEPMR